MGLYARLQQLAGSMGLVRVVSVEQSTHADRPAAPIQTRTIRLDQLAAEIRIEHVNALAQDPAELTLELHRVIEAAGVEFPDHGWTVDRLHESVAAVVASGADREAVRRAVLAQLSADGVAVEDVVRDAIARDRAVDAFEGFVREKFEQRRLGRRAKIDDLRQHIADAQRQIDHLDAEQTNDTREMDEWIAQKRDLEDRWANGLGYLIDGESPVTRDPRE